MNSNHKLPQSRPPHYQAIEKLAAVDQLRSGESTIEQLSKANCIPESRLADWVQRARFGELVGLMSWHKIPELDRLRHEVARLRVGNKLLYSELQKLMKCHCKACPKQCESCPAKRWAVK